MDATLDRLRGIAGFALLATIIGGALGVQDHNCQMALAAFGATYGALWLRYE